MKKKIILIASLIFAFACIFAITVSAECADGCDNRVVYQTGSNGFLGEITVVDSCETCGYVNSTEKVEPLFITKGYSYSADGSITQRYAVNRDAVARFEELTGEAVKFGAVSATRNHIAAGPIDSNGNPVSDKVSSMDFTNTKYDLFDVVVKDIPKTYQTSTEIICCAYVVVDGVVSYIDNGVSKSSDSAFTFEEVRAIVDGGIVETPVAKKQNWDDDGSLKILTIGNSYSDDATEYVYNVAKSLGFENVEVANLRANSCSLAMHLSNAQSDNGAYMFRYWGDGADSWTDYGSWSSNGTYKISTAVAQADWDYIIFQQVSTSSYNADSYDDLNALISIVEEINPTAKLGWHMTWSDKFTSSEDTMYNGIVNAVQSKIVTNDKIDVIIPTGTTIQNARTTTVFDPVELMRNANNKHLNYGLGRYAAALTVVKALTGVSIDNISYMPTADTEGHTFNYEEIYKSVVIEAVNNSIANPFEATKSDIYRPATEADLEGLVEVDYLGLNKWAYYDSTNEEFLFEALTADKLPGQAGDKDYFYYFSTRMFSKEQLPVGSVIVVESGWKYRPEGWVDSETVNETRPENVTTQYVRVTEKWWGDYTVRAFNISEDPWVNQKFLLSTTAEDIEAIFKVYVPQSAAELNVEGSEYEPIPTNPAFPEEDDSSTVVGTGKISVDSVVDEIVVINGKRYKALTMEAMGLAVGFYNSTSGPWLSTSRSDFAATKQFTNEELLNGMLIWAGSGATVRPEGWISLEGTNDRNQNISGPFTIEVTDAFWSTYYNSLTSTTTLDTPYTVRGFNYSKGGSSLETVYNNFKIYVPLELIEGHTQILSTEVVDEETLLDTDGDGVGDLRVKALTMEAMGLAVGFYNSTSGPWLSTSRSDFAATKQFTKETLLNGMLIWAGSGATVRPEGWISLEGTNDRNQNISGPFTIEVTDAFWSTYYNSLTSTTTLDTPYTVRGFNYSKGGNSLETVYNNFKIYVPIDMIAEAE